MRLHPAKSRGTLALSLFGVTFLVCASVAAWSPAGILVNASCILVVSLLGFLGVACLSYERKLAWQLLDYTLELITVVSLIAALAGIQQSAVALYVGCWQDSLKVAGSIVEFTLVQFFRSIVENVEKVAGTLSAAWASGSCCVP